MTRAQLSLCGLVSPCYQAHETGLEYMPLDPQVRETKSRARQKDVCVLSRDVL